MPYTLLYHPHVDEHDLPQLPLNLQRRIARAIETRLVLAPEQHSEPLKGTLKGYWRLRVGDYRIAYKIARSEIWILGIRHRKLVYKDVRERTDWRPS